MKEGLKEKTEGSMVHNPAHLFVICIFPFGICTMLAREACKAENSEEVYLIPESTQCAGTWRQMTS